MLLLFTHKKKTIALVKTRTWDRQIIGRQTYIKNYFICPNYKEKDRKSREKNLQVSSLKRTKL